MADRIDGISREDKMGSCDAKYDRRIHRNFRCVAESGGTEGIRSVQWAVLVSGGERGEEFAKTTGMAAESAPEIEEVTHLMAKVAMGPEFAFEIVESSKDKCVGRAMECPWRKRSKEQGLDFDSCGAGHQNWGDGAVESLNPDFSFKLLKNMNRGDAYCEWVIERKK